MRERDKCPTAQPPRSASSWSPLPSAILHATHPSGAGGWEWSLQSVPHALSLLLHPPRALSLLQGWVRPGRQSSTSCPSNGPSHGVLPLSNTLLQPGGYPTVSKALPANGSGMGSSLHAATAPARTLILHALSTALQPPLVPPAPAWAPPRAAGGDLLSRGPPWRQGQSASPRSAAWLQAQRRNRASPRGHCDVTGEVGPATCASHKGPGPTTAIKAGQGALRPESWWDRVAVHTTQPSMAQYRRSTTRSRSRRRRRPGRYQSPPRRQKRRSRRRAVSRRHQYKKSCQWQGTSRR